MGLLSDQRRLTLDVLPLSVCTTQWEARKREMESILSLLRELPGNIRDETSWQLRRYQCARASAARSTCAAWITQGHTRRSAHMLPLVRLVDKTAPLAGHESLSRGC